MHPEFSFFIYNSKVYVNNDIHITSSLVSNILNTKNDGHISLFEMNVNRTNNFIFPFVQSGSNNQNFGSTLYGNFGETQIGPDTAYTSSYPLSASIYRKYTRNQTFTSTHINDSNGQPTEETPIQIERNLTGSALYYLGKNKYSAYSPRFLASPMTSSLVNIIDIPSILYGSSVKKGSILLKYFITGTLIASAIDERQNGELISNFGNSSGSVVGLAYYDEGVLAFPSASKDLYPETQMADGSMFYTGRLDTGNNITYVTATGVEDAAWWHFGVGANEMFDDGSPLTRHASSVSASFSVEYKGVSYKNTMTLMCHANKAEMNWSNNPTFLDQTDAKYNKYTTSSVQYYELESPIKNVVSSSYHGHSASLEKTTYITKVGIYDKNDNLIMTAEMARPYRKEEERDITFKLKYDLI